MSVTRIYADENGVSQFAEVDVELADGGIIGLLSQRYGAESVIFRATDASYDYTWHTAPERQYIVILSGRAEVRVGAGEARQFGPGDVLFVEDTVGRGHCTRNTDGPRTTLFIPVGDAAGPTGRAAE